MSGRSTSRRRPARTDVKVCSTSAPTGVTAPADVMTMSGLPGCGPGPLAAAILGRFTDGHSTPWVMILLANYVAGARVTHVTPERPY